MTQLQQMASDMSSREAIFNDVAETLSASGIFGKDQRSTTGLTWGYYGGLYNGADIADGTVTLTDNATNYVVVLRSSGVLSVSTSTTNGANALYARLYKLTTVSGVVTTQVDQRMDANGLLIGGSGGGGGGGGTELTELNFTSDTGSTADSDPGNGTFKWNNGTQGSATFLYFDNQTADGVALTTFYASLVGGAGFVYMVQSDDPTKWQLWKVTAVSAGSGYYKFAAAIQANGGSIADNKTVYCDFTFAPASAVPWGSITGTLASQADLQAALDAKQPRAPNLQSVTSAGTVTPTFANDLVKITAQAAALTLANPTGTAIEGIGIAIRIKDNGTARAITYGTQYRAIGVTLPITTVINKTLYLGCVWNDTDTKLDVVAVAQEA